MDLNSLTDKIIQACYMNDRDIAFRNINLFIDKVSSDTTLCDKLLPILRIIITAMEKKDCVLLGDCFEYGIKRVLNGQECFYEMFNESLLELPNTDEDIYYLGTYSEEPSLCVKDIDGIIHRMNSVFSPEHEAEEWFNGLKMTKNTPAVCLFGLGTGLFAKQILDNLPEDGILIIYEPDRSIYEYCKNVDEENDENDIEKRISARIIKILSDHRVYNVVEDEDGVALQNLLGSKIDYLYMDWMVVAKHNNYDMLFPDYNFTFDRTIMEFRNRMQTNKNTGELFKENYVVNFLQNINYIKHASLYSEIHKVLPNNIPTIIVSAGPSLDKNIELIEQVKGHFFIVAVDTAIRPLLKRGIIPDISLTFDPKKPEEYYPDGVALEIPCMFSLDANPKIVSRIKGKKFIFNTNNDYANNILKRINKNFDLLEGNGGSIATAAFAIIVLFRQEKIILVGQDLAFDNGKSHAGGVNDQANYQESFVEGINGEKVKTRSDWFAYLKWFENSIKAIKKHEINIQVIDATEGGALIHGTEVMTLQQVIDSCRDADGKLPDYCFEEEIKKIDEFLSEEEYKILYQYHENAL